MTLSVTVTLTPKQEAGVNAAAAEFNAAQPEGTEPMTAADYLTQRIAGISDGYADQFQCGAVPVGEFIRRFTGAEIDTLKALAATDPVVAGFMTQLDNAPQGKVWLLSDTIAQAKAYLLSKGFDAARADVIFAVA